MGALEQRLDIHGSLIGRACEIYSTQNGLARGSRTCPIGENLKCEKKSLPQRKKNYGNVFGPSICLCLDAH